MKKKAFTLIELAVVITILGMIYLVAFSNFLRPKNGSNVNPLEIKSYLHSKGFQEKVALVCLSDQEFCLVYMDGALSEKINNPFEEIEEVFELTQERKRLYFADIKYEDSYERVSFHFEMDKYKQHNSVLLQTPKKLYVFNSASMKLQEYESINDYQNAIEKLRVEVKNAF